MALPLRASSVPVRAEGEAVTMDRWMGARPLVAVICRSTEVSPRYLPRPVRGGATGHARHTGRMDEPGDDLVIAPGPGLRRGLVIPASELVERFSRSSGPGGQGVNTTDSRVELLFDPEASTALTPSQRERLVTALAGRLVGGRVVIVASEQRSQLRNRAAARDRLVDLLREGLPPPPSARRAPKPTRGSHRRRLEHKQRRSQVKSGRGRVQPE